MKQIHWNMIKSLPAGQQIKWLNLTSKTQQLRIQLKLSANQ